jgi:amino acid transporter
MSQKVTNTGAFFAYVGRGLGRSAGVASAFMSLVGYLTIQLAIYGFFGGVFHFTALGWGIDAPWYMWSALAWLAVTGLSLLSVDVGAKVLGVFMSLEILSLIISSIAIFAHSSAPADFNASFSLGAIFTDGLAGTAGIAIAFAFASYIGFEATAIYGEEAKDPKKAVPRATYWAVGIITALFAFVSFAMATGMQNFKWTAQPADQAAAGLPADGVMGYIAANGGFDLKAGITNPGGVLMSMADNALGGTWMSTTMSLLVLSSAFAGLLAFQNSLARYFFALGRGGILGKSFAKTNKSGAPVNGVILTSALALVVIIVFAALGLDGIGNLFTWMSAVTAVAIMLVEVLVSIAIIVFFAKNKGENIWRSTIAPAISAVVLSVGVYLLMARFNLLGNLAAEGVDPTLAESAWKLSPFGWFLVLLPIIGGVLGLVIAAVRKGNKTLEQDLLS